METIGLREEDIVVISFGEDLGQHSGDASPQADESAKNHRQGAQR